MGGLSAAGRWWLLPDNLTVSTTITALGALVLQGADGAAAADWNEFWSALSRWSTARDHRILQRAVGLGGTLSQLTDRDARWNLPTACALWFRLGHAVLWCAGYTPGRNTICVRDRWRLYFRVNDRVVPSTKPWAPRHSSTWAIRKQVTVGSYYELPDEIVDDPDAIRSWAMKAREGRWGWKT